MHEVSNLEVGNLRVGNPPSPYFNTILITLNGPQIDPGYHGRIIVGVTNLTHKPVSIPFKDDILSLEIHRLEQPTSKPYCGPYQDRLQLGPEEIEAITEVEGMALSEVIKTLQSLSQNVGSLAIQMKTLRWIVPIIISIGIAVIVVIVAMK